MKSKISIVAAADNFYFIKDIVEVMQGNNIAEFQMLSRNQFMDRHEILEQTDILWLEWLDGITFEILTQPKLKHIKYIVRCHRYELFSHRTLELIYRITHYGSHTKKIDKLLFVSPFVQQIGIDQFPWMKEISIVIPNLIDHTKYEFKERRRGYNLLFLGRISYVKNMPLLLTFFNELCQIDNNWKLHIVGDISDKELLYYKDNFIQKTQLQNNIKFYGSLAHEDVIRLMEDMHYIICTSIFESQGMGIIEGMCRGLKPIIFSFPGAEYIYPVEYLFSDVSRFIELILYDGEYEPMKYHNFVVKNYSIKENIWKYRDLIEVLM